MLIISVMARVNHFWHTANMQKVESLQTITYKYSGQEFTHDGQADDIPNLCRRVQGATV